MVGSDGGNRCQSASLEGLGYPLGSTYRTKNKIERAKVANNIGSGGAGVGGSGGRA
jgi:hypothetical protein